MLATDDVPAASGGDEEVGTGSSLLHGGDFITGHGGLESVDRIDFSNEDTGAIGAERLSTL